MKKKTYIQIVPTHETGPAAMNLEFMCIAWRGSWDGISLRQNFYDGGISCLYLILSTNSGNTEIGFIVEIVFMALSVWSILVLYRSVKLYQCSPF